VHLRLVVEQLPFFLVFIKVAELSSYCAVPDDDGKSSLKHYICLKDDEESGLHHDCV